MRLAFDAAMLERLQSADCDTLLSALRDAFREIDRLRDAISALADQDATLTDAEREAVEQAIDAANGMGQAEPWTMRTLRGLLERTK